jgi:hypothetical protein
MKSFFLIFLSALLLLNGKSIVAFSQEQDSINKKGTELSYGVDAGFSNKYMWRGMCFNQGLVFQPAANISYGDLSFTAWSNIPVWEKDTANTSGNEIDFTLGYSNSVFNFDVETSLNYYHYFYDPDANTSEFFIGLGYPLGDFTLFTSFYVDILKNAGGIYDELGVEYEKELNDKWSVSGSLFTGMANSKFNSYYLLDENHPEFNKSAFNLLSANANLSYSPVKDFSINAHIQINHTLDKELNQSLLKTNSNYFEIIFRKEI